MLDKVQIRIVNNLVKSIPTYATKGSAGLDLRAAVKDKIHLRPNETLLIPTGLSIFIEDKNDYEVLLSDMEITNDMKHVLNQIGAVSYTHLRAHET